ncbi:MAG: ABC transporter permease [Acidimicrobiales bacterium]
MPRPRPRPRPRPERAAVGLARRSVTRGALALCAVLALMLIAILSSYEQVGAAAGSLESLAGNPAFRALYGQPFDITTAGGFAVWRVGQFLLAIAGLWAVMSTTRLLRGEEESGRWDLLLTAPIARHRLMLADVAVQAGACCVAGLVAALVFVVTGEPAGGAALFGAGVALLALTFVAVGSLTSQLFGQRRRAAGYGGMALGAAFLLRMVIDGLSGPRWLAWLTPFGWVEELRPFAGNRLAPLVPLVLAPAAIGLLAFRLSRYRDLGDGIFRDPDTAAPKLGSLRTPVRFAFRERTAGLLGWGGGLAALGLVDGIVTGAFTDFLSTNAEFQRVIAQAGFADLATVGGFVATLATFAALVIGLYFVSSMHVLGEDEEAGRLDLVYATRVTRADWLGSQTLTTALIGLVLAVVAAVATWVGVVSGSATLSFVDSLAAVANMLPIVALVLGVALLAHGLHPGLVVPAAGGALVGSYVIGFLGPAFKLPNWALDLSPFHHVSLVPVEPVAWKAVAVMLDLALLAGAAGAFAYSRRDLR